MKRFAVLAVLALVAGINIGAAFACNHDILCPTGWVWSDNEGSCIEASEPTM